MLFMFYFIVMSKMSSRRILTKVRKEIVLVLLIYLSLSNIQIILQILKLSTSLSLYFFFTKIFLLFHSVIWSKMEMKLCSLFQLIYFISGNSRLNPVSYFILYSQNKFMCGLLSVWFHSGGWWLLRKRWWTNKSRVFVRIH